MHRPTEERALKELTRKEKKKSPEALGGAHPGGWGGGEGFIERSENLPELMRVPHA